MAMANGLKAVRGVVPSVRRALMANAPAGQRSLSTALNRRNEDIDIVEPENRRASDLSGSDTLYPFRGFGMGLDRLFDNPFLSAAAREGSAGRRAWDAVENEDTLELRVDMPGLAKEDVKVYAEENSLVIKGEGKGVELDGSGRKYNSRIDLPPKIYKVDEIKAQMKNGVLRVSVPKYKEGEGKNIFAVNIE